MISRAYRWMQLRRCSKSKMFTSNMSQNLTSACWCCHFSTKVKAMSKWQILINAIYARSQTALKPSWSFTWNISNSIEAFIARFVGKTFIREETCRVIWKAKRDAGLVKLSLNVQPYCFNTTTRSILLILSNVQSQTARKASRTQKHSTNIYKSSTQKNRKTSSAIYVLTKVSSNATFGITSKSIAKFVSEASTVTSAEKKKFIWKESQRNAFTAMRSSNVNFCAKTTSKWNTKLGGLTGLVKSAEISSKSWLLWSFILTVTIIESLLQKTLNVKFVREASNSKKITKTTWRLPTTKKIFVVFVRKCFEAPKSWNFTWRVGTTLSVKFVDLWRNIEEIYWDTLLQDTVRHRKILKRMFLSQVTTGLTVACNGHPLTYGNWKVSLAICALLKLLIEIMYGNTWSYIWKIAKGLSPVPAAISSYSRIITWWLTFKGERRSACTVNKNSATHCLRLQLVK